MVRPCSRHSLLRLGLRAVEKAQKRSKMSLEKSVLLHPLFSTCTRSASLRFLTSNSLNLCITYPGEAELTSAESGDITKPVAEESVGSHF